MASEHAGRATSAIVCRDNLIWSNNIGGIFIGGYDPQRGRTEFCQITHNTLFQNDVQKQGNGEFYLQFDTRTNTFTHNLLVANAQQILIGNPYPQNTGNVVDWNLYFVSGSTNTAQWEWQKVGRTGFAAYRRASGNDRHSLFADPQLTAFHLSPNSPAVNRGDPAFVAASAETDLDGDARVSGGRGDIGEDKYTPAPVHRGGNSPAPVR